MTSGSDKDQNARRAIDEMTRDYIETGRKGGIAVVDAERVRRHVIGVAEKAEKKVESGEIKRPK